LTEQVVPPTRDELITMVARAHGDAPYAEATAAGKALAAQSKLPKIVAENLGAGFGQWDFFPPAGEIVDFALGYQPPGTAEDALALAKSWASDDANARPTPLALVGREILQHELKRFELPELRAAIDEVDAGRARELRAAIGLEVPADAKTATPKKTAAPRAKRAAAAAGPPREIPTRMPKPEFKRPPPPPPQAAAKKFNHPKFGDGELVSQDGVGEEAKLTIKFAAGTKTLLARFVTEVPS
jgi:hypothetical protein